MVAAEIERNETFDRIYIECFSVVPVHWSPKELRYTVSTKVLTLEAALH